MNVGVLLLTHENLGKALLRAVQSQIDPLPLQVAVLAVNAEAGTGVLADTVRQRIAAMNGGAGVLVLVDAVDLAPCRLALQAQSTPLRIVSGLNLPMLLGLFRSSQRGLDELAHCALQAGRQGIIDVSGGGHGQPALHSR